MYIDTSTVHGKYTRHLLRTSYRENGDSKHRTIVNLSHCPDDVIAAFKLALRHKDNLAELIAIDESISLHQGRSFGAVWTIHQVAKELGIVQALGNGRDGKLAMLQIIARVLEQGSRLSAVRLANRHALREILDLNSFNEDDLYANLDWLAENQAKIENRLFALNPSPDKGLYLYDVTSSYLEGTQNELSAFGYNRDKKKGKRQIVIGLLCDSDGKPLSVEVFSGNTQDTQTVSHQIDKLSKRFGGVPITLVGDRGMIKAPQIDELASFGMHYITAITKPQIKTLLSNGTIQMTMFDQAMTEVITDEGTRYVVRRNPVRAAQLQSVRTDKLASLQRFVDSRNKYLADHSRAQVEVAVRKITSKSVRLVISDWLMVHADGRQLSLQVNLEQLQEAEKFDGCYVIKTDLTPEQASKEVVHDRYKDLSQVEWAFRTCKTTNLEVRPVFVRRADRTRGHVFVVMLSYLVVWALSRRWWDVELTLEESLDHLAGIEMVEVRANGRPCCNKIMVPDELGTRLLEKAKVILPEITPAIRGPVATRKAMRKRRAS